jgi:hypothetical protein
MFYTYLWLREDGTPYYAGKGKSRRAFKSVVGHRPPTDRTRIVNFPMPDEATALESEIALIELFGRKDNGTGILHNRTDGGDGISGHKHSPESLLKMRKPRTRRLSATTRLKMRNARLGMKYAPRSAQALINMSNAQLGKKASAEARRNMSLSQLGNTHCLGNNPSIEARRNMSIAQKNRRLREAA